PVQLGGGLRQLRLLRGPGSRGRRRPRVTIASHPVQARRGRLASPPLSTLYFSRRWLVRGAGVEPASEAWKATVLPLDYPRGSGVKRRELKNPMAGEPTAPPPAIPNALPSEIFPQEAPRPLGARKKGSG